MFTTLILWLVYAAIAAGAGYLAGWGLAHSVIYGRHVGLLVTLACGVLTTVILFQVPGGITDVSAADTLIKYAVAALVVLAWFVGFGRGFRANR